MTSSVMRAALTLIAFMAISICAAQDVKVQVDGQDLTFPDAEPQLMYDNVMVPMRTVFEKMGGDVHWDEATRTATANVRGNEITLKVGAFEATVDGKSQYLRNAPVIVDGRTMIPIQFLENATGAQVNWSEPDRLVSIDTNGSAAASTTPTTTPSDTVSLYQNEVIPITLDQPLSSTENQPGDTFTATVNNSNEYAGLPVGTKIEGHVADVQSNSEGLPAILDLAFDRIVLPNGKTASIDGTLVSLQQDVTRDSDGIYSADSIAPRMIYAGYGSEQGLLLSAPDDRPLTPDTLDNSRSYLERQVPEDQRTQYNLALSSGTEMGVKINQETTIVLAD